MNEELEPSSAQPEDAMRLITAALSDVSVGSDVSCMLNGEVAANGFQHAGCDDELMSDNGHVLAASAGAGADMARALITVAQTNAARGVTRRRGEAWWIRRSTLKRYRRVGDGLDVPRAT